MVDTAGASLGGFDARKGQHEFSWRDAMDIPVRWRQISEPNDQVSLNSSLPLHWIHSFMRVFACSRDTFIPCRPGTCHLHCVPVTVPVLAAD